VLPYVMAGVGYPGLLLTTLFFVSCGGATVLKDDGALQENPQIMLTVVAARTR
jgi:hypothetical protein